MLRMTGPLLLPSRREKTSRLRLEDHENLAQVTFHQFQRLSAKPTAGESSTGLGLAIVKAIAEAHGGTASVTSPGKSVGATFTVTLPWLV